MILGFTGTRRGMTPAQLATFRMEYAKRSIGLSRFLHGGAAGADTEAHGVAVSFTRSSDIHIYPSDEERAARWMTSWPQAIVSPPMPPLQRNRIIAQGCDQLIACPAEADEQLRSGTWATVRYARAAGKPITIIIPGGSTKIEDSVI